MAEIHALLFVSGEPLCTDDIMAQLHISRGNASMNLRGLVDWGLIQRQHKLGDRKEYFQADTDVWHMFETIMRERRRREVEPIIDSIERCRAMIAPPGLPPANPAARDFLGRLEELQRFLSAMGMLFELVVQFGRDGAETLLKMAGSASPAETAAVPMNGARARPAAERRPAGGRGAAAAAPHVRAPGGQRTARAGRKLGL